jgi:hypothetical protein
MFALKRLTFIEITLFFALLILQSTIRAETIEDFKRAKSESEPCKTIPYSSERDRCIRKRDDVSDYCKTEESSCTALNTYARMQDLEKAKRDLANLDRSREELIRQRDSASDDSQKRSISDKISSTEKDIDDSKRSLEQLSKTVDDYKYKANGRVEKAKRCREARIDAVEIFDEAEKKAKSETDPGIQSLAAELISQWKEADRGHTIAIKETQERLLTCDKAARGEQF